jgi:hypothetical protein
VARVPHRFLAMYRMTIVHKDLGQHLAEMLCDELVCEQCITWLLVNQLLLFLNFNDLEESVCIKQV